MKKTAAFLAQLQTAFAEATAAYEQAITAHEQVDRLLRMVAVDDPALYQRVQVIEDQSHTAMNKARDAKLALDTLMNEGE